jgi:hypothetical protein
MLPSDLPPAVSDRDIIVPIAEATDRHVKAGIDYWQSLRAERPFPARSALTLRGMAAFLAHTVIVRVIGGGADYEYRFAGDAQNRVFRMPLKGIRVSQIEAVLPQLGATLRGVYDSARTTAAPFVVRGRLLLDTFDSGPSYHETAFLPLGESDDAVDHLLLVGVNLPKPFWDIPEQKIGVLKKQLTVQAGVP